MNNAIDISSDSDLDDINWFSNKRKQLTKIRPKNEEVPSLKNNFIDNETILQKKQRFEELKAKANQIRTFSNRRLEITEKRKAKRLVKKALRDPFIKELVNQELNSGDQSKNIKEKEEEEWKSVKPFLNVNNHLQGPVSHGEWGPKNEVESLIDKALQEADFEKAELLSDTLANKQFAGKICKAFAAKRQNEKLEEQKASEMLQKKKKIRWTFETKERWQMKGNM
ncbi:uncharacterized protein CDAR_261551 [Caerostris darwini]|uniref:Protein FAM204A n=1 Tax=Caerostris darwini TaxID=1538125 RepID=A0AAV4SXP9_9ARAC|nr:uncharacterized protein CDAR_261551 [Caerostris darwini]